MLDTPGPLYDAAGKLVVDQSGMATRAIAQGEPLYLTREPAQDLVAAVNAPKERWGDWLNAKAEEKHKAVLALLLQQGRVTLDAAAPAEWSITEEDVAAVLLPDELAELDAMLQPGEEIEWIDPAGPAVVMKKRGRYFTSMDPAHSLAHAADALLARAADAILDTFSLPVGEAAKFARDGVACGAGIVSGWRAPELDTPGFRAYVMNNGEVVRRSEAIVCTCPVAVLNASGCQCGAMKRERERSS